MFQTLLAASMIGFGIYLFSEDSLILGIILFVLGAAMLRGASEGVWFCFGFGDSDGDGGCDGGD
jgi:hypothetical protein